MYTSARRSIAKANHWETVIALIRITTITLGVYWLAIFVATHLPSSSLPSMGSDKVYHLLAFSGLSFLLTWVMSQKIASVRKQIVIVLTITILYAIFDEWSQQFVAGRQPDVSDAIADTCGAILGLLACLGLRSAVTGVSRRTASEV